MNKYSKIAKDLKSKGGKILRGFERNPEDLDVYVPKEKLGDIINYIEKKGFFKVSSTNSISETLLKTK